MRKELYALINRTGSAILHIAMASEHSYIITANNNRTEKAGISYLLTSDERFILPTKEGRRTILKTLKLDKKYVRAFDLVMVKGHTNKETNIAFDKLEDIVLVELKTTRKSLAENPKGFFFGATENEFDLARQLGENFRFCFVCLHENCKSYALVSLDELEKMIRTKRVQYQINL